MAVLFVELRKDPVHFQERCVAFLAGHRSAGILSFSDNEELSPLIVAVDLAFLDWVHNSPNPQVRVHQVRWVPVTYGARIGSQ